MIFMGAVSQASLGARIGQQDRGAALQTADIVTVQHYDYTGRENVRSRARITDQIPERCLYTIMAATTTRFNATYLTGLDHP